MKAQSTVANQVAGHYLSRSMAWILPLLLLLTSFSAGAVTFTAEEQKLANFLTGASGQNRDRSQMRADDRLTQVARSRAMDMAKRRYFSHTNPDGVAANYLVRATGYALPSSYSTSRTANSIESIGAGYVDANEAWGAWMGSSAHKSHLLATDGFYRDQTSFGIGHYYDSSSPYRHYWVIITAPPSAPAATLSIATPTANSRVTAPSLSVSGTVSGNAVFASLQYRLETSTGAGTWNTVTLHSGAAVARWTANVGGLRPGTNTVRVRTLAPSGAIAKETTRSVRLVEMRPLVVAVEGEGSVTAGFAGTTQREMGAAVTIGAIPKAGNILSHWTGLPEGLDPYRPAQSFLMQENLSLVAHFIADPFPALAAVYGGVFTDTGQSHGSSGALFARITSGGAFTGAVFFSGQRLALRGRFNSKGDATVTIPRVGKSALTLALHVDPSGVDQRITGTISDGTATMDLNAGRGAGTATAGQYNVHFSVAADPATPSGYSFAILSVATTGVVRVSGVLADGTVFAANSNLIGNTVPIYAPLFGGTGSVAGSVTIENGLVQGNIAWHKPARAGTRFPASFDTQHTVSGSLYVRPLATEAALPLGDTILEIDSPELPELLNLPVVVDAGSIVSYTEPRPAGWKLVINPRNGRITGTYAHPGSNVRAFSGLIDSASASGYGFSLAPAQSAAVFVGQ